MAPPRQQRTATVADDSRSEASSGPREPKTTTGKGRKGTNGTNSSSRADGKASAAVNAANANANVTSAPAQQQPEELPNIPWSDMPLDILHSYRHAYNLPIPSAYSKTYSHILLSQGIGLRSPTSIAVQRAQIIAQQPQQSQHSHRPQPASSSSSAMANGITHRSHNHNHSSRKHNNSPYKDKNMLNRIIGQSRVSKEQLALAVRKHFNSAGLAEQETIARLLYKVREEGKGRQFRLRFQP